MKRDYIQYGIFILGRIIQGSVKADEIYLRILFRYRMKYTLSIKNPKTYNEKLQWLKLYDRKSIYTEMVDKYAAKEYASKIVGDKYIIPTLGVWNNFEEIDFDELPNQFVLKCTHDSGGIVICKDKRLLDRTKAKKKIKHCLNRRYFNNLREWPYKNVPPRIIAEQFISQENGDVPVDYKFFCFGGKIDSVMLCFDREIGRPKFVFFDMDGNRLLYQNYEPNIDEARLPDNFQEMKTIVEKLCKGFVHIRIDLYCVQGEIYFGEYTFFDQSGFDTDITYETDKIWGEKIELDKCGMNELDQ